jgi:transcriptional regulator with XRE-family HTH domain
MNNHRMDPINRQVADRLKKLRQQAGLSLEQLARASGVSRAMLSQIETLKANPTIAVLWRIAGGLEVSFAELLGEGRYGPQVDLSRAADARYLYSEDGAFRSRPLLAHVPGHRVELYELCLEPGAVQHADPHPAGSFEQLLVTKGKMQLGVLDASYELGPGDALFFPADRPHSYACVSRGPFVGMSLILYG